MAKRIRVRRIAGRRASSFLNGALRVGINVLQSPILLIGLSIGYYYFNNTTKLKAALVKAAALPLVGPAFTDFSGHLKNTAGAIAVASGALSSGQPSVSIGVALVSLFSVIYFLPEQSNFLDYGLLAVFVAAFFKTRNNSIRIVLFGLALVLISYEIWGLKMS